MSNQNTLQVSCLQENLARGLATVKRAVARRSTALPVLRNVLVSGEGSRLKLSATDLQTGISCWVPATPAPHPRRGAGEVEAEGAVTVPAGTLADLVKSLPAERIDLSLNGRNQTLNLRCGRAKANLKGLSAEDFPLIPGAEDEGAVLIDADVLARLTRQVAFAAATEESRLMLTGVLTKLAGDQITMAAADGFRLSVATGTLSYPVPKPMSLLVPAQSLADLGHIAGDQEEPVKMTVTSSGRQVVFSLESAELVSQLIDLQFPDYEQIVPKGHTTRTVVDRQALLKACRRASIFAREAAYAVKLRAERGTDVTPGRLTVFGRSDQAGDNTGQIDAEVMGEEVEIMFNVRYFLDALPVIDTAQVALETTTARAPGAVRPVGDEGFVHVLMPMYDENKAQGK